MTTADEPAPPDAPAVPRSRLRSALTWSVIVVVVLHGLLHLLGAAKGLGVADVSQLRRPIGVAAGLAWLAGAALVVGAGLLLAAPSRRWWMLSGTAVIVSQALVISSWDDAKAGTIVNVILAAAVVQQYAARGPRSLQVAYRRQVAAALAGAAPQGPVTEAHRADRPAAQPT